MEKEVLLEVENLFKKFKIGKKRRRRKILARIISFISGVEAKRKFSVLENINFSLRKSENLGIIGKNGSGKTTLLKILGKIYSADKGTIENNVNTFYLSSMANGLKTKLSVEDNVFLVGSILGLSQRNIRNKLDEIIDFAGLEDFVGTKVYQLSTGMKQRLAFSITIHCLESKHLDVLLLDEVFGGGGDEEFKIKGLKRMDELLKKGITIIFVSHDMNLIKKYCKKVIWLDKGKIKKYGNSREVVREYLNEIEREVRKQN